MGYVKIWVHLVWTTKYRKPLLTAEVRRVLFPHIRHSAARKGIYIDFINGYLDHVHCLVSLKSSQSIDKIMFNLKGESSHWINSNRLTTEKFSWQTEYFAISVCESALDRVRNYIKNQEKHHQRKPFREVYGKLMTRYRFEQKGDED